MSISLERSLLELGEAARRVEEPAHELDG